MKNAQPTKASQGKISTFLKSQKGRKNKGQSEFRSEIRGNKAIPSSTKGAGGMFNNKFVLRSRKQLRRRSA